MFSGERQLVNILPICVVCFCILQLPSSMQQMITKVRAIGRKCTSTVQHFASGLLVIEQSRASTAVLVHLQDLGQLPAS